MYKLSSHYVARTGQYILGVMIVVAFLMSVWGCAGKLKLPDLGSVDDLIDTSKSSHEYKTEVKIEIKTDLDNIPVVDMSPGIIMPPIIPLPTNTPFASPDDPTQVPTMIPTVKPTAPPLGPKPTRIPDPPVGDMEVSVSGIPEMTRENMEELNKTCIWSLKSGDDRIAVFHRYLSDPPSCFECPFEPSWVLEYFRGCRQISELTFADWQSIGDGSATFAVDITGDGVIVTCNGEPEAVEVQNVPKDHWKLDDRYCDGWKDSPAIATLKTSGTRGAMRGLIPGRSILGL